MMMMEESMGKDVDHDHDQSLSMETSPPPPPLPSKPSNLLFKLKIPARGSSTSLKGFGNAKQHICSVCNKGFSSGKALGGHIRIHMDRYKNRKLNKLKTKTRTKTKKRISKKYMIRSSSSKPAEAEEAEEEEEEEERYVSCCICKKNFRSMKSLFGHMRNHPERGWRGIRPPPASDKNSSCSSLSDEAVDQISGSGSGSGSNDLLKSLPKWGRRTNTAAAGMWIADEWISEEIPEAAYSLMKLARGDWKGTKNKMKLINNCGDHRVHKLPVKGNEEEISDDPSTMEEVLGNPSGKAVLFEEAPSKPYEAEASQEEAGKHFGKQVCSLRDFDLNEPYASLDGDDDDDDDEAAGF